MEEEGGGTHVWHVVVLDLEETERKMEGGDK